MTIAPPDAALVERFARDLDALIPPRHGEGDRRAAVVEGASGWRRRPEENPLHQPAAGPPPPPGEQHVGLAVSGGPDSLALLLLAAAARPGRVAAATVDHGLRPEAADEARFVADICARLSVPHATLRVTVTDDRAGLQAAARTARYAALEAWTRGQGLTALLTAHHLDDQAETVLMRVARGAGVTGLAGIRPRGSTLGGVPVLRPLLDWRRAELAAIVAEAGLAAIDDPSNRNPRFDRARIREHLSAGWPDPDRLALLARNMADAEEALAFSAARLFRERFDSAGATLEAADLPRDYRRRLLLKTLESLGEPASPRGDELDRLLDRLAMDQISTLGGWRITPGPLWRFSPAPPHRSV